MKFVHVVVFSARIWTHNFCCRCCRCCCWQNYFPVWYWRMTIWATWFWSMTIRWQTYWCNWSRKISSERFLNLIPSFNHFSHNITTITNFNIKWRRTETISRWFQKTAVGLFSFGTLMGVSVTRFGKILPLLQYFKSLWPIFKTSIRYLEKVWT